MSIFLGFLMDISVCGNAFVHSSLWKALSTLRNSCWGVEEGEADLTLKSEGHTEDRWGTGRRQYPKGAPCSSPQLFQPWRRKESHHHPRKKTHPTIQCLQKHTPDTPRTILFDIHWGSPALRDWHLHGHKQTDRHPVDGDRYCPEGDRGGWRKTDLAMVRATVYKSRASPTGAEVTCVRCDKNRKQRGCIDTG